MSGQQIWNMKHMLEESYGFQMACKQIYDRLVLNNAIHFVFRFFVLCCSVFDLGASLQVPRCTLILSLPWRQYFQFGWFLFIPQTRLALMGFSRYCPSSLDLPHFLVREPPRSHGGGVLEQVQMAQAWPKPGQGPDFGNLGPGNPEIWGPKK